MRLTSLRLLNYRQHADSAVHFPLGIISLTGANESGKTGCIEAVCWCLYGTVAVRGSKGSIRWNRAPARRQAEATLVFQLAGVRYRIERSERDAKLVQDATGVILAAGTSAVDGAVPKLLGMSWREFSASHFASQKDLARLASMLPTERQTLIREVMGVGRIDTALVACRKRTGELRQERAGLEAGLGSREGLEAEDSEAAAACVALSDERDRSIVARIEATDLASAARADLDESEEKRERHDELVRRRELAGSARRAAESERQRTAIELEDAELARARLLEQEPALDELPALRLERDTLRQAAATEQLRAQLRRAVADNKAAAAQAQAEADRAAKVIAEYSEQRLQEVAGLYRKAEAELRRLRHERISALESARASQRLAAHRQEQILARIGDLEAKGESGTCDGCGRVLGDAYRVRLASLHEELRDAGKDAADHARQASLLASESDDEAVLEAEIDALRRDGESEKAWRSAAQQAAGTKADAERRVESSTRAVLRAEQELAQLPDAQPDSARLDACERSIAELEALDRRLGPDRSLAGRIQLLTTAQAQAESRIAEHTGHMAAAQADIDLLHFDAGHHGELRDALAAAETRLREAHVAHARINESLRGAEQRLSRARAALSDYDARAGRLRTVSRELSVHERAADALNRFRADVAGTIRPELEELTSGFVALLTDGRHEAVTLSDAYEVTVHESGVPVEVISGGAEDVAALALRLAVSQMIAERAGHPLSLLVLDEVFGSLDDTRRGNVLSLLRRLGKVFEQIVLVSHVEETKYACDHAIEVTYAESEGRSYVRQAAAPVPAAEEVAA